MDVNSITDQIINLNQTAVNQELRTPVINDTQKVSKDDALNVSVSDIYNKQRDELSYSLQTLNEGIAVNQISKQGLEQQAEKLSNVEDKITQSKDKLQEGIISPDLKNEISKDLVDFNTITNSTTYKDEKLLTVEKNEDDTITVSTKQSIYTLDKPETREVLSELAQNLESNDLISEDDLDKALVDTQDASKKIDNFISRIDDIDKIMVSNAKNTITDQIDLSKENSSLRDIDFGAEVEDFSKTNINANLGFLAGTQAHIVQEQSVRLLAK